METKITLGTAMRGGMAQSLMYVFHACFQEQLPQQGTGEAVEEDLQKCAFLG